MYMTLYILYAVAQAILAARYGFKLEEKDNPVFAVSLMAIFAPVTTLFLIGSGLYEGIMWLVTYRPKNDVKKEETLPSEPTK